MSVWLAMKQALTMMDLVTRRWGRELELDEAGVMVLALLAERDPRPAHELALKCGRARQQVQRSLRMMERRELIRPAIVSATGRTQAWGLTDRGVALWRHLERAVNAWDKELESSSIDAEELSRLLRRMVEMVVNRPGADGWRRGLLVPNELLLDPIGVQAGLEGLLDPEPEEHDNTPGWTQEERESAARAWQALWR